MSLGLLSSASQEAKARAKSLDQVSIPGKKSLVRELKRFFLLCSLSGKKPRTIPGSVDAVWHETLKDEKLCAQINAAAGTVLHHAPGGEPSRWKGYDIDTKRQYKSLFGPMNMEFAADMGMLCWGCGSGQR